jgi:uncharacterized Zn-binding protein involved in type VI secretion
MSAGSNAQKTPLLRTLNEFATRRVASAIQLLGKSLPASVVSVNGSIVTVKFEIETTFTLPRVTLPIATSQWRREPTQVGDMGVVRPSDAPLGAVSGLGAATASLVTLGNLEALVWEPVASSKWTATPDANAYVIWGPNGFICRDTGGNCSIIGDTTEITAVAKTKLTLRVGSSSIVIDGTGVTINGVKIDTSGNVSAIADLTSTGNVTLSGGAQFVKLADGSNATKVKAT